MRNLKDRQKGSGKNLFGGGGILNLLIALVAGYYGVGLTLLLSNTGANIATSAPYTPYTQEDQAAKLINPKTKRVTK